MTSEHGYFSDHEVVNLREAQRRTGLYDTKCRKIREVLRQLGVPVVNLGSPDLTWFSGYHFRMAIEKAARCECDEQ